MLILFVARQQYLTAKVTVERSQKAHSAEQGASSECVDEKRVLAVRCIRQFRAKDTLRLHTGLKKNPVLRVRQCRFPTDGISRLRCTFRHNGGTFRWTTFTLGPCGRCREHVFRH